MAQQRGFTLIELMIVIAIIAIIASIAIPNLISARVQANETAAIATLRSISSAQAQFHSAVVIDADEDGGGEYGYFGEMSGAVAVRSSAGINAGEVLASPTLSAAFGAVVQGVVTKAGYMFRMSIADSDGVGVAENTTGGAAQVLANDNAEMFWCCYAWPISLRTSGTRAFFINQQGDVLQTNNQATQYNGLATPPEADAAFISPSTDDAIIGLVAVNTLGTDGNRWIPVN